MARLSSYLDSHKRTHTNGLTAVAADIRKGKFAYSDGIKRVGTGDLKPIGIEANEVILLMENPRGLGETYDPAINGGILVASSQLKGFSGGSLKIDPDGYSYSSASYFIGPYYAHCSRRTSRIRKYELWGKTKNAALTSTYGLRIYFNVAHQWNQFWVVQLFWNGSNFVLDLSEWTSPTSTSRASYTFASAIDEPLFWHLIVYDAGDTIIAAAHAHEGDSLADRASTSLYYNVASRIYKDATGAGCGTNVTPGDQWLIRGFSVMDLA